MLFAHGVFLISKNTSFVLLFHFPTIEVCHSDLGMTIILRLRMSWPRTQTRVLFVTRVIPSSLLIGCKHQCLELRHPHIMHSHATFNRKRLQNRICSCDVHLFVRLCQVHVVFPTLPVLFVIFPLPFLALLRCSSILLWSTMANYIDSSHGMCCSQIPQSTGNYVRINKGILPVHLCFVECVWVW